MRNHERELKRRKIQFALNLDETADDDTIAEWLDQVESLSGSEQHAAYKCLFVNNSQALVEKFLSYISIRELMRLMSEKSFAIMSFLGECINLKANNAVEARNKLYLIGVLIFKNHRSFKDNDLIEFWRMLYFPIKSSVLQAQKADVFSSLIVRASEALFKELLHYIEDNRLLSLMMHDDFELCRLFVRSNNIELTLKKLKRLLKNRFTEPQKSIMLALFKSAIKENAYPFFEQYREAYPDYFSILIMPNQCDLLITACNSPNPLFLEQMLLRILEPQRRKALSLIATWLSIELNTAQIEHDHLRQSINFDLQRIMVLIKDIVHHYDEVKDEASFSEARLRIIKQRRTQIPEAVKRALITYLALQSQARTQFVKVQKYLSNRISAENHYCIDEIERAAIVSVKHYFGFEEYPWTTSQEQEENPKEFKATLFGNFSQMRTKQLIPEIKRLQNELASYRACDISDISRIALPHLSLEEQHEDAVDFIILESESLNSSLSFVWLKSLDMSLSMSLKGPHYLVPGNQVHLGLSAALRSQTAANSRQSMLVASLGFFIQFKKNIKQHLIVPVRVEEKTVVKIDPKIDLLTEGTDELICSHPLKRLINYLLLDNKAMNKILAKATKRGREGAITYVRAVTIDCHTNQMPCEDCLKLAHSSQKKRTIVSKIEKILISSKIRIDIKKLPLLFRISIESIEKQNPHQLISATPQSKLTKPDSQLSPLPVFRQKEIMPSNANLPELLVGERKPPIRLFDLKTDVENRPPMKHFKAKIFFRNPEKTNLKAFSEQVIVLKKLEIQPDDLENNYSPPVRDYTVFEGSCSSN